MRPLNHFGKITPLTENQLEFSIIMEYADSGDLF